MTLLAKQGYEFISPSECDQLRRDNVSSEGKTTSRVVLLPVIREFLSTQTYIFTGKPHKLSEAATDKSLIKPFDGWS